MERLRRFMYGRYGFDQFSQILIILALIISVLGSIVGNSIIIFISYIPLVYSVYRVISKNINKRTQENYKYLGIKNSISNLINKRKRRLQESKTHRFYKCPQCKQNIRVPKGKGKICITCPKCRTEFIKKT